MPDQPAQDQSNDAGQVILAWEYPEFIQFRRGVIWYIVASILTVALLTYAFFTDNRLFMIIIILTAIIFVLANVRQPEKITFAVTDSGVIIKDKFLPFRIFKSFWLIYQPPAVKTLYLEPHSFFSPRIQVHLESQDPVSVREALLQFLTEDLEKEDEPQSEVLGRLLK